VLFDSRKLSLRPFRYFDIQLGQHASSARIEECWQRVLGYRRKEMFGGFLKLPFSTCQRTERKQTSRSSS